MIAYYITSHGFGHAARACAVIRALPPELPLTLITGVPAPFLRERLGERTFALRPRTFDCGTLGPDSSHVDFRQTLERAETLQAANELALEEEVAWLRAEGVRVVISDVVPFALRVAAEAGVRSLLVANFTWSAIYAALSPTDGDAPDAAGREALRGRMHAVITAMQRDYDRGGLLLVPGMDVPMTACRERRDVPLIAPHGARRRTKLSARLGLDPARRIVLVYLGREGMEAMDWRGLHGDGNQYVTFAAAGGEAPFPKIPDGLLGPGEAVASVDAVVAKTGYGICAECIAAATPLLYPPRAQFAEYAAAHTLMQAWGGGWALDEQRFRACAWREPLDQLIARSNTLRTIATDGAEACARTILELLT